MNAKQALKVLGSYRLTPYVHLLLEAVSKREAVTKTVVVETAVREYAREVLGVRECARIRREAQANERELVRKFEIESIDEEMMEEHEVQKVRG